VSAIDKYLAKKRLTHQLAKTASVAALLKGINTKALMKGAKTFLGTPTGKMTAGLAGAAGLGLAGMAAKRFLGRPSFGQAAMSFVKKHKVPLAAGGAAGVGLAALGRRD
jgi:hypothetical protein